MENRGEKSEREREREKGQDKDYDRGLVSQLILASPGGRSALIIHTHVVPKLDAGGEENPSPLKACTDTTEHLWQKGG